MKIFVSYTMQDEYITSQLLERVASRLEIYASIYVDILHNDSSNKQERVEGELESSNLVVLINSESIYKSKWVQREINLAKDCGVPILKYYVNGFMLPIYIENNITEIVAKYIKERINESRKNSQKYTQDSCVFI